MEGTGWWLGVVRGVTDAPNRLFTKGVRLSVSPFFPPVGYSV